MNIRLKCIWLSSFIDCPNPDVLLITEKGEETLIQQESCMYPDFPGLEKEEAELVVARTQAQLDKRMWSKFQSWLGMMMYVVLVALICSHSDVPTAYCQNEHLLQTISTVYTVSRSY